MRKRFASLLQLPRSRSLHRRTSSISLAPTDELEEIAALAASQPDESAVKGTAISASTAPVAVGTVISQPAALDQGQQASGALESRQACEAQGDSQNAQPEISEQAAQEIAKEVVKAADSCSPPRRSAEACLQVVLVVKHHARRLGSTC